MFGGNGLDLGSKQKRAKWIIIACAVIGFLLFAFLMQPDKKIEDQVNQGDRFRIIDDDRAAKTRWVGEAATSLRQASEDVAAVRKQNTEVVKRAQKAEEEQRNLQRQLSEMQKQIADIKADQNKTVTITPYQTTRPKQDENETRLPLTPYPPMPKGESGAEAASKGGDDNKVSSFTNGFVGRQLNGTPSRLEGSNRAEYQTFVHRERQVSYRLIDGGIKTDRSNPPKEEKKNEEARAGLPPIPAGTIIPVVSITGVDAPTMSAAKSQPLPMLWRVKDISIIPNANRYDIVGCHILAEAAGDLPSERVMVRANALTCYDNEGTLIESSLSGYAASGTDSKNGIRGKVVSKQGAILARVIVAGFLEGVAEAFSQKDQIIMSSAIGTTTTTDTSGGAGAIAEAGAYKGLAKGMNRLAEFYLDMADQVFPIIELSGGTEADIIVTATQELEEYSKDKK